MTPEDYADWAVGSSDLIIFLSEAVRRALRDETPGIKAAYRLEMFDALRVILLDHWPVQIICDHSAKTDQVVCACSRFALPVGEAKKTWIEHVLDITSVTLGGKP